MNSQPLPRCGVRRHSAWISGWTDRGWCGNSHLPACEGVVVGRLLPVQAWTESVLDTGHCRYAWFGEAKPFGSSRGRDLQRW